MKRPEEGDRIADLDPSNNQEVEHVKSKQTLDFPSQKQLRELYQGIHRWDQFFFVLKLLDQSMPINIVLANERLLIKFFLKYKEDIGQGEVHHDDTNEVTDGIDHVNVDPKKQPVPRPLSSSGCEQDHRIHQLHQSRSN